MPPAVALLNYMKMTIKELYYSFAIFFPRTGIFRGFYLHIFNFAGRPNEAAMGGGGGGVPRSAQVLRVKEPKKTGVRNTRARTRGKKPLVLHTSRINILHFLNKKVKNFSICRTKRSQELSPLMRNKIYGSLKD